MYADDLLLFSNSWWYESLAWYLWFLWPLYWYCFEP